jgi:hypothetical protein
VASKPDDKSQRSANEKLIALEIVRQILLLRFSLHVRGLIISSINATEFSVAAMIRDTLSREPAILRDPAQVRKVEALVTQVNAIRQPAWNEGMQAATEQLAALADDEPQEQQGLFSLLLPGLSLIVPPAVSLLVLARPFQGRTLQQWLLDARDDDAKRIRDAIFLGVGAGESPAAVARRVVGSAAAQGADGATQTSRNHVDTIVRSATTHASAGGRDEFYRANKQVKVTFDPVAKRWNAAVEPNQPVPGVTLPGATPPPVGGAALFQLEQFVAVLDNRTTKLCRSLNNKRYAIGEGPIPPLHMNCRSIRVLVLPPSIGGAPFDPGSYATWIRRQPFSVRVMLLGTAKAKTTEDDSVDLGAFQDYGARPMSLEQVKAEGKRIMDAYS